MSTYVLVGAGGTGSHLTPALLRYLDGYEAERDPHWQVVIIDGDHVEHRNLARQLFVPEVTGANKATALFTQNPTFAEHVQPKDEFLGPDNISRYILDGDIVLIAADNMFVRKLIEDHVRTLNDSVVINGGNESISGSVQLYVREGGKDITPRLSHLHPEFARKDGDRSALSCAQIAELPGGEQTVLANMTSATMMLAALWRYHKELHLKPKAAEKDAINWTEFQFDHLTAEYYGWDVRTTKGWADA